MRGNNILDKKRIEALESFEIMDSEEENLYNDITALAAAICNTPISLISLVDEKRQFFKSHYGLDFNYTPIEESFCKYLIQEDEDLLVVENTHIDKRFANHPSVKENPAIGFYAGVSLTTTNGYRLGTLCVLDYQSKKLDSVQLNGLKTLAQQVIQLFELRKSKKNEENQKNELERKGDLLNNIVEATQIGIWERDIKYDSFKLNDEGLKMIGHNEDDMNSLSQNAWESLIHPSDLSMVKDALSSCFNDKSEVYDIQYRIQNKKGHILWVHDKGKILTWNGKEPVLMYGTIQNITEKVNRNSEIVRLKNNQEAIINSTEDLLWSVDTEFRLIIANNSYHKLIERNIGYQFKEGDFVFEYDFNKEISNKWKAYYERALKGERFSIKEKFHDPSKKKTTYGLTSFDPLYDKERNLIGVTCFSKDITAEVLAQQVTTNAKEELERIMDASLDIICTFNKEGYFLTVSEACKRILGYAPKELIGRKYIDFIFNEDRPASQKSVVSVISGSIETYFENRYIHKNGNLVHMLWSSNWNSDDEIAYCSAKDITEQKKSELQLEQSERRFKTLVQEGTELIAIFDQEAKFIYVSPSSKNTLKMSPEELLGSTAFDHIHLDDHEAVYAQFMEVTKNRQVYMKPFRFKNGEGDWRWLETIATNQLNEPSINGIVVNTRDVTDRILHLRAIEKQNTKLKEIAWTQSHIVRAPVARLMGLINLIRDKKENLEFEEKERMLQYIIKSAEEIDSIIKKIVDNTAHTLDIEEIE
ncbi:PAS domain S-box protein [Maribacter sp. ACAM166]|uniref:PAS domain S-box protein n=1 Tax=Maribacter sp. ACAM166 TaxID=2508996 RepID=UPI0010FF2304|nr:PAS domain S-box protein [Maribacter sp. ACAM166]TLP72910.1 PAS domain S-box protein [Maribacter sp. ACAM166]